MLNQLKKMHLVKSLRNTLLGDFICKSSGDWRYPFIALGWNLSKILVPRRMISADGVNFNLSCTNWITHFRWFLFKKKEVEVRNYINEYVKEGDIFFDVGANVGVFTVYCGKRFENVRVYSFEPEYSNLFLLKENVIHNQLMSKVKIHSVGVSDFVGISQLNIQDITPGAAVHTENKDVIKFTDEGYPVVWTEGISTVTIDYICAQLNIIPNALKIDTDGNEDKVIRGAQGTLKRVELRSLVIEMPHEDNVKEKYCKDILESSGFSLAWSDRLKTKNEIWMKRGESQ